jgi:hypothetical protein
MGPLGSEPLGAVLGAHSVLGQLDFENKAK